MRQSNLQLAEADPGTADEAVIRRVDLPGPHRQFLAALHRATGGAAAEPAAWPEIESDGAWLTASQRTLGRVVGRSADRVGVYVRDCRAAGYLATRQDGRRLAYRIDVAAVVDRPHAPLRRPAAANARKAVGVPPAAEAPALAIAVTRRAIAGELVRTLGAVAVLAVGLVAVGWYGRRKSADLRRRPSIAAGDRRQYLLFGDDLRCSPAATSVAPPPTSAVSAPTAVARPVGPPLTSAVAAATSVVSAPTAVAEAVRPPSPPAEPPATSVAPHVHDHGRKNEMTHEHEACAASLKKKSETGGWPYRLKKADLLNPEKVARLYEHATEVKRWFKPSDAARLGFEAAAVQAAGGWNPGGLLTHLVTEKGWEKSKAASGISDKSEAKAEARLKQLRRSTAPPPSPLGAGIGSIAAGPPAANYEDQVRRLATSQFAGALAGGKGA